MPPYPSLSSAIVVISDSDDDADAAALWRIAAERFTSSLTTQADVDALCEKHGIPGHFTARPAGDRRACTPPQPGEACVYAHALEAGVRFPLQPFFSETLSHFGLAPSQLTPNGWRVLLAFVALCRDAGAPPSVAVLRHFFSLTSRRGWYCFKSKSGAGALVTGQSKAKSDAEWKRGFFFLASPDPWPCPVRWGEPLSGGCPVLSSQDKKSVKELVYKHGPGVDLRTYLREANLAVAFSSNLAGASAPPPLPLLSPQTTGAEGMDPSAETETVSTPSPDCDELPLSGKKRKQGETANVEDAVLRALSTPPPASPPGLPAQPYSGRSASVADPCARRGFFDPKPRHSPLPDAHDGDSADWKVARKALECVVTPSREDKFAASKPSDVVASTYVAMLQAANYASFSLDYTLELEEKLAARDAEVAVLREQLEESKAQQDAAKLAARDAEVAALREQLEESKAEQAAAKRAAEAEVERAKAAAVQQFLKSKEHTRQLAEHALAGYERGAEEMKRAALRLNPRLDAARLVLPLD